MLELIVAMSIGTLLLTQCSKPKQANNTKSTRRSSEKPGQKLVQESQMGGFEPVNNGGEAGGEEKQQSKMNAEPKGKSSRDERNADGGGGEDQEGGKKERQKTKTNKSRLSNKKTAEAQGPSSTKPSKPMDGTQGNQTDAQKTSNAETKDGAMEATVYEFLNPVCNELARLDKTTGDVTEVQFKGNVDKDIGNQEKNNEELYQQIDANWKKGIDKLAKRIGKNTNTKPGEKVRPADKSITEKSEKTEVSKGKQRVRVNNKKSLLFETTEQYTEDNDPDEQKNAAEGEKKT